MGLKPLKRLPKGDIESPYSCPIGRALKGKVEVPTTEDGDAIFIPFEEDASVKLLTTKAVDKFIAEFDSGNYPELIRD